MQKNPRPLAELTDSELLAEIKVLAASEREATVRHYLELMGLEGFGDRFPAREGAARVRIHECDPRTCPLRKIRAMSRPQIA